VSVVGVPFAFGQPLQGVDRGPIELRKAGLQERIMMEGWNVDDRGDIDVTALVKGLDPNAVIMRDDYKMKRGPQVSAINKATSEVVESAAKEDNFVLSLGGDHSIAIGTIAGILKARPDTGIIWVDAHADINTPKTTLSGNVHGMCVAFLMKHPDCADAQEFSWLKDVPTLDPRRIVYIGLRDVDSGEKRIIRELGIRAFTMQDVDRHGIGRVMDLAIEHVRGRANRPLHLSLDIDGVDPLFAPSTGTRVGGGLTYREAYYLCETLAETGLLASMDMVEVNPSIVNDPSEGERTVKMAVGLIASALGNRII